MKKVVIGLGVVVAVLALAAAAFWWLVLREDAPPPPELSEQDASGRVVDAGALDGPWTLVPHDDRYAGYRIGELFGGDRLQRDAVARTSEVEGSLTIADDQLTAVEVTADLTALESEDATAGRRDRYLQENGLEIAEFPEATFTLTEPVDLAPLPAEGVELTIQIEGELTLHGVTQPVEVDVLTRWVGDTIEVAGAAPIVLSDFGIEPPDVSGLASVADDGEFEIQMLFERAAG
jgi:polyisoprenoid-binding protein YceI